MVTCAILPACAQVAEEDLAYVLGNCHNLTAFSFVRHPELPFVHFLDGTTTPGFTPAPRELNAFNPTWILDSRAGRVGNCLMERLAHGARSLSIDLTSVSPEMTESEGSIENQYLEPLTSLLFHATSLTSLTLGPVRGSWVTVSLPSLPHLHFPLLESLHLNISDEPIFYSYVQSRWKMERLTRFTLISADDPLPLLRAHGSRLTYLAVCGHTPQRLLLPHLSSVLPVISHLALKLGTWWQSECLEDLEIHSPTLRYLNIFSPVTYPTIKVYKMITLAKTARAPGLQNIRLVGCGFGPNTPSYYPILCDPALLRGDVSQFEGDDDCADWREWTTGGILYRFEDDLVRQKWWCVVTDPRAYADCFPPSDYGGSEEEESKYEYESPTESDDSSSCSSSESDLRVFVDSVPADDGPLDRETILSMFRRGLDRDYLLSEEEFCDE